MISNVVGFYTVINLVLSKRGSSAVNVSNSTLSWQWIWLGGCIVLWYCGVVKNMKRNVLTTIMKDDWLEEINLWIGPLGHPTSSH